MISTPGIMAVLAGLMFSFGFLLIVSGIRNSLVMLRYLGGALVSVPLGGITYVAVSARVGASKGLRFYSIPFGATELHSRAVIWGSAACWMLLWLLVLALILARLDYGKRERGAANGR